MYQEKTPAFLVQQQLLKYAVQAMVTLLGKHCSWECENTGKIHWGYITAICIDGTVKTCSSRAGCKCTQLWRHIKKNSIASRPKGATAGKSALFECCSI